MPTPPPVQPDPAIIGAMLRATLQRIPINPNASEAGIAEQREVAVIALTSLRPRHQVADDRVARAPLTTARLPTLAA